MNKKISIIIPVYNEEKNIPLIYSALMDVQQTQPYECEYIFVNDGSTDGSQSAITKYCENNSHVKCIEFSRNFGKEIAITAGLNHATGDAAIIIDADLQHPVSLIPEFIAKWKSGAEVVIGIRKESKSDSIIKRWGSFWFYKIMSLISDTNIERGTTDYRLLDRHVIDAFNALTERTRMTRGLIDWLGFRREYIYFDAQERKNGHAQYSFLKLFRLAISGFISHSLLPLRLAGYLGGLIMLLSSVLGIVMIIDRYYFPLGYSFSGPAILAVIILFLVGIILISIGILAVYIGNIHQEVQNRPLYIVRKK